MAEARTPPVFGKRTEPHTVIIARGDQIRHFTVRPWVAALAGSVVAAFAIGYLLATSYLVLRDDLIGATVARQARLQQAYEDRISALRAQVDRITSRQLLDQQLMENKVAELLGRQAELTARDGRLRPLLERANGGRLPKNAPLPSQKPDLRADLSTMTGYAATPPKTAAAAVLDGFAAAAPDPVTTGSVADEADRIFVQINQSLRRIETQQITRLRDLTENAYQTAESISAALKSAGLSLDASYGEKDVGGPLVALEAPAAFEAEVIELDEALNTLDAIKAAAKRFPIANPVPGQPVTSGFGVRKDPLLGRPAHHSGMDFRARTGHPVRAAGAGVVVKAGWNGGYGRMVEIDHGDGLTTRYAHMSKLLVRKGEKIESGAVVGKVGSSGRSTGPHLHYEVRRKGSAINPLRMIKAGKKIRQFF
ncbi:M23 family metallopeptidase [Nitratireductor sp. StC3]|uniref:M23 family metallopeptidase n=1 Tax=Nitratireductor sp. StC3 TaxID=2126741 RepID=UPI000D0C98ED|nr:M23 family metallopeptidase [Nitratireductor sp. StC3]PSM18067.1 peptidase [Nitratireductor sp. StC3]